MSFGTTSLAWFVFSLPRFGDLPLFPLFTCPRLLGGRQDGRQGILEEDQVEVQVEHLKRPAAAFCHGKAPGACGRQWAGVGKERARGRIHSGTSAQFGGLRDIDKYYQNLDLSPNLEACWIE